MTDLTVAVIEVYLRTLGEDIPSSLTKLELVKALCDAIAKAKRAHLKQKKKAKRYVQ